MDTYDQLRVKYLAAKETYKRIYIAAIREFTIEISPYLLKYDEIVELSERKYIETLAFAISLERREHLRMLKERICEVAFQDLLDKTQPAQKKFDATLKEAQAKLREIETSIGEEVGF